MDSLPLDMAPESSLTPDTALDRRSAAGLFDAIAAERARAVARETGIFGAQALIQLGLVSERSLAEGWARLLNIKVPALAARAGLSQTETRQRLIDDPCPASTLQHPH